MTIASPPYFCAIFLSIEENFFVVSLDDEKSHASCLHHIHWCNSKSRKR